jgi:hypothetical protein
MDVRPKRDYEPAAPSEDHRVLIVRDLVGVARCPVLIVPPGAAEAH